MYDLISEYQELACDASLTLDGTEYRYITGSDNNSDADILRWEDSLYFLTANRVGPESVAKMSKEYKVGNNGEFLFGTFSICSHMECGNITSDDIKSFGVDIKDLSESNIGIDRGMRVIVGLAKYVDKLKENIEYSIKHDICQGEIIKYKEVIRKLEDGLSLIYEDIQMADRLVKITNSDMDKESILLQKKKIQNSIKGMRNLMRACDGKNYSSSSIHVLVNSWLSHISEIDIFIDNIPQSTASAKIYFTHDGTDMISPFNLGSGMSYLAKVLILCFLAKPGDVVMIENPEIHLHPRAQSRLGEFFAFMAGKGIQLVIETHCEHLLSSLRYQVYKDRLRSDDVILYYKADDQTPFEQLRISKNGRYMNREGKQCGFPKGFFDVSVRQLMEIG